MSSSEAVRAEKDLSRDASGPSQGTAKVGIVAKPHRTDFTSRLREILAWLPTCDCDVLVDRAVIENYGIEGLPGIPISSLVGSADFIVVFGGDGTILSVAREVAARDVPILGVNMGTLGFLTSVKIEAIQPALQRVLAGDYSIDRRQLLRAEVVANGDRNGSYEALNDVVINKAALARIIRMDAFIDHDFIAQFPADGLIVSTPTGSTAYSLSAGGPILFPSLEAITVTPICPHTLTNRPIVVPFDRAVRLVLRDGQDVMLTVDGQIGIELSPGAEIVCTRSPNHIDLIKPGDQGFFDVLREKLKWGER